MPPADPSPRDPREGRRPKDSEFYQIPPDLKKEFEMVMAGRGAPSAPGGDTIRAQSARRLGKISLALGLAGIVLVGAGPLAAIVLGLVALRRGSGSPASQAAARVGVAVGLGALLLNAATFYVAWRVLCGH